MRHLIQNRLEFKTYCMRKLGLGVQNVEVTDDQIEDCIDDALAMFTDFHYDGSDTDYLLYILTEEQAENQEVMLPEFVASVSALLDSGSFSTWFPNPSSNLMSQVNINNLFGRGGMGLGGSCSGRGIHGYVLANQYMGMINSMLNWSKNFRYNRFSRVLKLDTVCREGMQILVECDRELDVNTITEAYNSTWLKKYAVALIKKQWGFNLTKFTNALISQGVSVDGAKILSDADTEIEKLELELRETYSNQVYVTTG